MVWYAISIQSQGLSSLLQATNACRRDALRRSLHVVKAQRRRCKQEEHFRTWLMNRSKAACVFFMSLRREVEKSATVRLAMLWSPWHISSMSP